MEKRKDLNGMRFGKLIALELSENNPKTIRDGKLRWKCQCDCGKISYVLPYLLTTGRTKSCGCGKGENFKGKTTAIDLTGKRFGRLTVLEREENYHYKNGGLAAQWKCRCDCGNIVIKKSSGLLKGDVKSCGCLRKEIGNNPFAFEIGQEIKTKHGRFTVINRYREERELSDIKDKKYVCQCLDCGENNIILEHTLLEGIGSCKACSDCRSFGERFFYWFLKQFNIDFDVEYSPFWIENKRYDFHFAKDEVDYIAEIDGAQHIKRYGHRRLSHEEIVEIDQEKEAIAKENNHIVIRIDCQKSKGKYIKESIEKSDLKTIFNLNNVDWNKCFYMAMSKNMKLVCDLWNNGYRSTREIQEITKINKNYVSKLLVSCAEFGLCDYDSIAEQSKGRKKTLKNSKKIVCKNNGMIFQGAEECSRKSKEVFGVYLNGGGITRVCRKERKAYKGFQFEYVENKNG